jgi:glycosyltransferase involved in cell wall biosynthesis
MGIEYGRRDDAPAVSVVIPSVPASDHGPTVACLDAQSLRDPYEVLVVDDDTVDRSAARNAGLRAAKADVVALTDDDTRPPEDWLENVLREFRADAELVCLEGAVYGGCRNFGPRHYVGCNLAVRRDVALSVGGFRSEFSEWREDVEFGWRMEAQADGSCRYSEDVRMCHPGVPRTAFKPDLERRLKREYPDRYAAVMDATLGRRLYRRARAAGITQPLQRVRNALRRLVRGACYDPRRNDESVGR